MSGIYYLAPTLIAIVISLLIVRVGAVALMMTGMSFDKEWLPTPRLSRKLMKDDYLVIYGKLEDLAEYFG